VSGPNEVHVELSDGGQQKIQTKNVMIATGSDVSSLPGLEIDEKRCALANLYLLLSTSMSSFFIPAAPSLPRFVGLALSFLCQPTLQPLWRPPIKPQ
jgi:hypothetical protein